MRSKKDLQQCEALEYSLRQLHPESNLDAACRLELSTPVLVTGSGSRGTSGGFKQMVGRLQSGRAVPFLRAFSLGILELTMKAPVFPMTGNPYQLFDDLSGAGEATRWVSAKLNAGCKKAFALLLSGELEGPYGCRNFVQAYLHEAIEERGMSEKLSRLGFFDTEGREFIECRLERLFQYA